MNIINIGNAARLTICYSTRRKVKACQISAWISWIILGFLNPNMMGQVLAIIFIFIPSIDSCFVMNEDSLYNCGETLTRVLPNW